MYKDNELSKGSLKEVVASVLADLEKRVQDKVIEPSNFALLKKLIEKAETADEAIKIAELGTTYKRTGFHFDKRLEKTSDTISYFKKNTALSFTQNPTDITHKLIIGDNYPALLNLLIQYRGRVSVIYIDPPYGKDSMGEYAQTNYENNITRDNLLSMLYPRLVLAKQLLSDSGVIFCSIDDRNQAYVKGLFDEVFEEKNFVYQLSVVDKLNGNDNSSGMMETAEYCLIYARKKDLFTTGVLPLENDEEEYAQWQKDDLGYWKEGGSIKATGVAALREDRPNLYFPLYINEKTLDFNLHQDDNYTFPLFPMIDGKEGRWTWQKEKFIKDKQEVIIKKVGNGYSVYKKQRPSLGDMPSKRGKTTFYHPSYSTANSSKQIKELFGANKVFDFTKSVCLIRDLLYIGNAPQNACVLDFFAGSGTTGQAVLELNKLDGGKRQYICVQLNEDLDKALLNNPKNQTIKNQIALCDKYHRPHELSEITAERLRRVMTGKCYDGSTDFEWNKKNVPLGGNLEVCNIATVSNFETAPTKTAFEVIDETLYGQDKFATVQEKVEWVCLNFEHTQKQLEAK